MLCRGRTGLGRIAFACAAALWLLVGCVLPEEAMEPDPADGKLGEYPEFVSERELRESTPARGSYTQFQQSLVD